MALTVSASDSELQKPVNVIFNQMLLRNARPLAAYFVGTMPGSIERRGGSATIKWRRIENITPTTTALSELTNTASYMQGRNADTASFTDVTATVSKYGQFYILNEEVDTFNPVGQTAKLVETLAISAGRSLNRLQRDVAEDNVTLVQSGGAASDGVNTTTIELTNIRNVVNTLQRNSAMPFAPMSTGSQNVGTTPMLPAFWGLTHSDVAADIEKLSGFKGVETYAGQVDTLQGEFGALTVAGQAVRFVSSPEASIDTGSGGNGTGIRETSNSADLYTTVIYARDAFGSVGLGETHTDGIFRSGEDQGVIELIVKQMGSGGTSDPFDEIMTLAWKAWHAGAELNSAWARGIRSAATSL